MSFSFGRNLVAAGLGSSSRFDPITGIEMTEFQASPFTKCSHHDMVVIRFDYYVDRDIFTYHHEWLQQNVIATLYIKGSPPMRVQKPMSELQEF
jgi:hypothetical protein